MTFSTLESPWKPKRHMGGANVFVPKNKYEELLLVNFLLVLYLNNFLKLLFSFSNGLILLSDIAVVRLHRQQGRGPQSVFQPAAVQKIQVSYSFQIPSFNVNSKTRLRYYRIYSRISREILDNFWHLFFQFDLYACRLIREYIR